MSLRFKTVIKIWSLMLLAFLLSFTGAAFAADSVTPSDGTLLDLAQPIYAAFAGGHYALCACLAVVVLVGVLKRYSPLGPKATAWLHSDMGGVLAALVTSTATACAAALAAPGAHLTLGLLETALLIGVGAAGGYAALKNVVVEPILLKIQARMPAQLQWVLGSVLWIFDHGDVIPSDAPPAPAQPAPAPTPAPQPAPEAPAGN